MNKKKLSVAIFATAILTLASVASARSNPLQSPQISGSSGVSHEIQDNSTFIARIFDEDIFYPMDAYPINNVHHSGLGAYMGEFGLSPSNGIHMNVWVRNNGTSSVFVNISRNGTEIVSSYEINFKGQKTFNFEDMLGSGLSGEWKVYIYNKTGAQYNLDVNARQY